MKKIDIFCVGGTIDKVYFDAKSDYQIGEPVVKSLFEAMCLNFDYDVISLMKKDSLEMTDSDRQIVFDAIARCDSEYIVMTHGTDTMADTASVLSAITDKTIVITGALQPARFRQTDADFNLGVAIGAVQSLCHGVYIAMNGQIFKANQVRKDRELGRFVEDV